MKYDKNIHIFCTSRYIIKSTRCMNAVEYSFFREYDIAGLHLTFILKRILLSTFLCTKKIPPITIAIHPHRNGNRGIRSSEIGRNLNYLNYIMFCQKRQSPIVRQISTFRLK